MDAALLDVDSDWAEDIAMEEDDSGGEDSVSFYEIWFNLVIWLPG